MQKSSFNIWFKPKLLLYDLSLPVSKLNTGICIVSDRDDSEMHSEWGSDLKLS